MLTVIQITWLLTSAESWPTTSYISLMFLEEIKYLEKVVLELHKQIFWYENFDALIYITFSHLFLQSMMFG